MSYIVVSYWLSPLESDPRPRLRHVQFCNTLRGAAMSKRNSNQYGIEARVFDISQVEDLLPEVLSPSMGPKTPVIRPPKRKKGEKPFKRVLRGE